jgi:glycosyltransferase involved in cell wall biosynthesis
MPHITFVSYEIAPATPGGAGVFVSWATQILSSEGYRISLLLDVDRHSFHRWTNQYAPKLDGHPFIRSFRVDDLCESLDADRSCFPSEAHWRSYRFACALRKVHETTPIDFVEFFDYCGAAYYSLVLRAAYPDRFPARIAIRLHLTIEMINRRVASDFESYRLFDFALERAALGLADLVLSSGERFWREECAPVYPFVEPDRVHMSPPGARDLSRIAGAGQGNDVVFVGRVSTFKGMDRALSAAAAVLNDSQLAGYVRNFVMIGPDEAVSSSQSEAEIRAIANDAPTGRVIFTGRLNEAEIRRRFADAAVAVFPSRIESFCYAAHEAHLAGVPLVLSDIPTFRDYFVDGESGLFFNGAVGDLIDKLRIALTDAKLRARLSNSVEPHRDRYRRHEYGHHLGVRPFEGAAGAGVGVVAVMDDEGANRASYLRATYSLSPCAAASANVRAFARRWELLDAKGNRISPSEARLPCAASFAQSFGPETEAFLSVASRMLANEPRIGVVVPAELSREGFKRISPLPTQLARLSGTNPKIAGAVFQMADGATIADFCEDGSALTEHSLLLRQRGLFKAVIDFPDIAVPRREPPAGSDEPQSVKAFLRRFAWSVDPVQIAEELASLAPVSARLQPVDSGEIDLADDFRPSSSESLIVSVPAKTRSGDPNRITILRLRRNPDGPAIAFDDLPRVGRWLVNRETERPGGMLIGEGGTLEAPGILDAEVVLLTGPDQGTVIFARAGRSVRLDLRDKQYWHFVARISELFALVDAETDVHRTISCKVILNGAIVEELAAAATSDGEVVIARCESDQYVLRATGCTVSPWVTPDGLRDDPSTLAKAIALASEDRRVRIATLLGGATALATIERLLEHSRTIRVNYVLHLALSWEQGGWEFLRETAALARRHPDRLTLRTISRVAGDALTLLGVPVERMSIDVPRPRFRPGAGKVKIILPCHSPSIPSCGHIAAGIAEVVRRSHGVVESVYIPALEPQIWLILEQFASQCPVYRYDDLEQLIERVAGSKLIYCCPFADGSVDAGCLHTFGVGGLSIIAPGPVTLRDPEVKRILEVPLWEDAEQISKHVLEAIENYDELIERLLSAENGCSGVVNSLRSSQSGGGALR